MKTQLSLTVLFVLSFLSVIVLAQTDGTEKWSFTTGHWVNSSPAIGSNGTVYVGSWDDKVYALNPDGTEKWSFTTGDPVESSPAIGSDGTIYVGSLDDKVYALNSDGTKKWSFATGGEVWSSPAIGSNGIIFMGSKDSKVYALNPDGTKKWSFTTGGSVWSSPAIDSDGTVYVGSYDNKVYALNPDGTEKWSFTTGGDVSSSPAIGSDGTVYVGSSWNKKLYALHLDGTHKWSFSTGDIVSSSPAIGLDGTVYVGSRDNKLYAIKSTSKGLARSVWPKFHQNNQNHGRSFRGDLIVTYPNASNIVWILGEEYTIQWDYTVNSGSHVRIELHENNHMKRLINSNAENNGSHAWRVPNFLRSNNKYQIKIISNSNPAIFDLSDNFFRITNEYNYVTQKVMESDLPILDGLLDDDVWVGITSDTLQWDKPCESWTNFQNTLVTPGRQSGVMRPTSSMWVWM